MEKFFSNRYNCMIQQITKRTSRKLFEAGKYIFLMSSNMRFENMWCTPYEVKKDSMQCTENFDYMCNDFMYYNCDYERGKYIHFFIREKDLKQEKKSIREMSESEINELTKRQINALLRKEDDSHIWPICGRFNATERAIRKLKRLEKEGLEVNKGLEYYLTLNDIISQIINKA